MTADNTEVTAAQMITFQATTGNTAQVVEQR